MALDDRGMAIPKFRAGAWLVGVSILLAIVLHSRRNVGFSLESDPYVLPGGDHDGDKFVADEDYVQSRLAPRRTIESVLGGLSSSNFERQEVRPDELRVWNFPNI